MKKRTANILVITMLIAGVSIGTVVATASAWDAPSPYSINENGQTYGGIYLDSTDPPEKPDLIAAIGLDGTKGYVYPADLRGDQPSTPEEALQYMEDLEQAYAKAKATGEQYSRYIPLYASDGITVIGEFGISFPVIN